MSCQNVTYMYITVTRHHIFFTIHKTTKILFTTVFVQQVFNYVTVISKMLLLHVIQPVDILFHHW